MNKTTKKITKKSIKINKSLQNFSIGDTIEIEFKDGVPVSPYWRRRLEDSKRDGCITILEEQKTKTNNQSQMEKK